MRLLKREQANVLKYKTQAPNASIKRKHPTQALMGATRLASGKCHVHTLNKGSQTVLITRLSVSLCRHFRRGTRLLKKPTRDASPPLELAFSGSVGVHLLLEETLALMGATRLASGKCHVHTLNKGSQTVLITRFSVSLCFHFRDETAEKTDAGRVAPIRACV